MLWSAWQRLNVRLALLEPRGYSVCVGCEGHKIRSNLSRNVGDGAGRIIS